MVMKAGGLLDPMFVPLDHYARLHRMMEFGADPPGFLQHFLDPAQGQTYAGQLDLSTAVPYSPLFYIVFAPLNALVPDPDMRLRAINLIASALDASNGFFLFYALKRAWGDGLAGVWASAVFIAFPLSNLPFSDGSYPGILATWLLVLLIAALSWGYPRPGGIAPRDRRWGTACLLVIMLTLALLAHTANALLLGTTLIVFVGLVAWADRRRLAAVAGWAAGGLVLAFLSFYQFSAVYVVTDLLTELLARLRAAGEVGKSPDKLGAPLLSGFWPQISAHFGTWPMLIAGFWMFGEQKSRIKDRRSSLTLWLAATLIAFAAFSLLDIWINMLQKQMIYVIPALALLDGLALAALCRRGRAARVLCLVLWSSLFATTLLGWVARVVADVLPPGSG